jgi:hypothetical protein
MRVDTHDQSEADRDDDEGREFTLDDALRAFAAHLVWAFQMPAEQALARVNRELAAKPETAQFQLQLRLTDLRSVDGETDNNGDR